MTLPWTQPELRLHHVPDGHAIYDLPADLLGRLRAAQEALLWVQYPDAEALVEDACRQTGADPWLAAVVAGQGLHDFAELTLIEIVQTLMPAATAHGANPDDAAATVTRVAERVQLLRAFADPDDVLAWVKESVRSKLGRLPRSVDNLMVGLNPGDVIDPFMVAAAQELLYGGAFEPTIQGMTAHKALMMMEDLIGHLHQEVIGRMRGNVRVPEPAGKDKERLDFVSNPFPGADIMQPPWDDVRGFRFHQVKNKTGSAKGGDGKRPAQQLKLLLETYGGEIYFDAVLGNTLKGHRSMGGILKEEPRTTILVGEAAFIALTGSAKGAELLLRVYQTAFRQVASENGYSVASVAARIARQFEDEAFASDEDYLAVLLRKSVGGNLKDMSSRTYVGGRRARAGKPVIADTDADDDGLLD